MDLENLGTRGSAKPSFGLLSAIVAGQLTVYKREDFHIQSIAPSVTRMMKRVVEKIVEENTQATQKGFQLPSHSWSMDPLEATECLRF